MAESFEIFELEFGGGHLGICPLPGRFGDYTGDMARIADWGADLVLTMVTDAEMAGAMGDDLARAGIAWAHLPVGDFGVPDAAVDADWPAVSSRALDILGNGGRVLSHCYGGCGRSGMALLRLMVDGGNAPEGALTLLRTVRPCAVETDAQYEWASNGK